MTNKMQASEQQTKGITAVIGIILLVAVAVILIVIIATFFIGFTTGSGRDLAKSAPSAQVISAAQCDSTAGTVRVANSLTQDIKVGTRAEIKEGTKHYGFVRTTLQAIAAGASAVISFAYEDNADRPFAFKDDKDYTITFVDGPAKTQSFSVKCLAGQEFIKASLDASTDQLCIKATESLDGAGSASSCLTVTTPVQTFTQTGIDATPGFGSAPSGATANIIGVHPDGTWFVTNGAASSNVKTSINDGVSWVDAADISPSGLFSGFFTSILFAPTKIFALVAADGSTVSARILETTDGAAWTTKMISGVTDTTSLTTVRDMFFSSADAWYVVGQDAGDTAPTAYLAKSTDRGATWIQVSNIDDGTANEYVVGGIITLDVSGTTRIVTVGTDTTDSPSSGVVRYSDDDGSTWTEVNFIDGSDEMKAGYVMGLDDDGNAVVVFCGPDPCTDSYFWRSSDGASWTLINKITTSDVILGKYRFGLTGGLYFFTGSAGNIYRESGGIFAQDTSLASISPTTFSEVRGFYADGATLIVAGKSGSDVVVAIKDADTPTNGDTFTLFEGGNELASDATGTTFACLSEDVTSNTIVPTCVSVKLCPADGATCLTHDIKRGAPYEFKLEQSLDSGAETLVGSILAVEGQ